MTRELSVPAKLASECQAAAMLGCSVHALRAWRLHKTGPAYSKIGRLVRYRIEDLEAFINAGRVVTR